MLREACRPQILAVPARLAAQQHVRRMMLVLLCMRLKGWHHLCVLVSGAIAHQGQHMVNALRAGTLAARVSGVCRLCRPARRGCVCHCTAFHGNTSGWTQRRRLGRAGRRRRRLHVSTVLQKSRDSACRDVRCAAGPAAIVLGVVMEAR